MNKDSVIAELSKMTNVILDNDGVIPERYLLSWRADPGDALCVVVPTSIEEIRSVITYAKNNKLHIVAQGQRTGLVGGSVPRKQDGDHSIIISMERFRNRLEYNEIDRRVVVDAGYSIDEVNDFLLPYGVHVPINVSSNPMVGGAVATNIGGSRVVRFGDARHLLLGIEVVLGDSKTSVYSTLNRPRKDNSSINFTGVFCGSFGAYGIITSASLEVFPLFSSTYTAWISLKESSDITDVLHRIESQSKDLLLACEFVSAKACEVIGSSKENKYKVPFSGDGRDVIFVEWGTTHENFALEETVEQILGVLSENKYIEDIEIVAPDITWKMRHLFSEILRKHGKLIANDISVPRDKIQQVRENVASAIRDYDDKLIIRDFGHLGDGGLHINVLVEDSQCLQDWTDKKTSDVRKIIAQQAQKLSGSFSAEHGLGSANTQLYKELIDPVSQQLAIDFKKICDPDYIFGHEGIVFASKENHGLQD